MQTLLNRGHRSMGVLALAVLLLAGCAQSRGGSIPYDVQNFSTPDPQRAAILPENYQLAPGDKLSITVFQVEDLSGDYSVDLSGNVAFPLVGTINALNLTASELGNELETRLAVKYLQNPDVTVGIKEATGRTVTIDGAVQIPGRYAINSKTTLLEAVAQARGPTEFANPRRVAIFRRIEGQRMAAAFDLKSIRQGETDDPSVYPGDVIVVEGGTTRQILRDLLGALPVLALFRPY
jgi:polysaccharide export outer membrane protein